MNEEPLNWFDAFETATQEAEQLMRETAETFVETVLETTAEAADAVVQAAIATAEYVEVAIATELDRFVETIDEWFQPPVHLAVRLDIGWDAADLVDPWLDVIEPSATQYAACMGCKHYHGRIYRGTVLVCGMHPYGWDGKDCPDWEK